MKKTVAVVVVLLMCSFVASAALAFCKGNREAEVTISVTWAPSQPPVIRVGQKDFDPIPCVYRRGEIEVTVTFTGNVPNNQELKLSDFRALIHAQPPGGGGGSFIHDFDESANLEIQEWSGSPPAWNPVSELVFDATTGSKTIKLEGQRGSGGPRRLITYKLEMGGSGNVLDVVFDPPWGERP